MFNRWSPIHQWVIVLPLAIVFGSFLTDQAVGLIAPADLVGVISPISQIVVGLAVYIAGVNMMENSWPSQLKIRCLPELLGGLLLGGLACLGIVAVLLSQHLVQVTLANGGIGVLHNVLRAGLVAGVLEEVIFRGIILRRLQPVMGTRKTIGIVALAFGATHMFNPSPSFLGLIGAMIGGGLFLSLLFIHTRSIWLVIGFHMAWNTVQGPIFGSPVSGGVPGSTWLKWEGTGPWLLSGGQFGLEASLLTIIGFLIASSILWTMVRQKADNEPFDGEVPSAADETVEPVLARPAIFESLLGIDQHQEETPVEQVTEAALELTLEAGAVETANTDSAPVVGLDEPSADVDPAKPSEDPERSEDDSAVRPAVHNLTDLESGAASQSISSPSEDGTVEETASGDDQVGLSPATDGEDLAESELAAQSVSALAAGNEATDSAIIGVGRKMGRPYLRLLGQVRLEGMQRAGKRKSNKAEMEMLAYLALHPAAGGKQMDEALWPKKVSAKQVTPRIPVAGNLRSMLGASQDGTPRLAQRSYALHDLDSDWQEFQDLTSDSASQDQLKAALSLVRGEPLSGVQGRWAHQQRILIQKVIKEVRTRVDSSAEDDPANESTDTSLN